MSGTAQPATGAPQVSVVMTSYQDPWPRLQRAIDSILQQSFRDLEILVALSPRIPTPIGRSNVTAIPASLFSKILSARAWRDRSTIA